ncbi:hypothetical protein VTH8203_01531 [Vibrio thalassae]|uniref:DNA replication terminus site-binding protein n=1 Tax=Vibrio thalassae TaxID=1243014 RepID=A0A240EHA3_9VIBR|nr:DNA replication terminus site-binding protein [Vibrio thalassae]SNX47916.1 hypothetical protein VTH8203_01531 [Vibrio thalassae]
MASIYLKQKLIEHIEDLTLSNQHIYDSLTALNPVFKSIQSVPQFARGEALPSRIYPENIDMTYQEALSMSIFPQPVYREVLNLPKRYTGLIQFFGNESQCYDIHQAVLENSKKRKTLFKLLKQAAPASRKRAELSKSLMPDILIQTLHRKIPLVTPETYRVRSSWCESQSGLKRMKEEEALAFVHQYAAKGLDDWQLRSQELKIKTATNIYKKSTIRLHPQYVVASIVDGKSKHAPKKAHSPLILVSNNSKPIDFTSLEIYSKSEEEKKEHIVLEGYEPLIEGTCLVHRKIR